MTARYLRGDMQVRADRVRRRRNPKHALKFSGATIHNLKNISVEIPLGMMVVVSGVSGSGKSTLVHDVIYRSLQALIGHEAAAPRTGAEESDDPSETGPRVTCSRVEGAALLEELVMIDQSPIGRTPRSNPVTYIQAFDLIRTLFAGTAEARKRGLWAGHFSFNVSGGRCETCQGEGTVKVEMQFLADVELICEECKGTRFKSGILEVRYQGLNIYEALRLTVREALDFFKDSRRLVNKLQMLDDVGLGYLRLGQSATTLSGGEAQRVKLAAHLGQASCERTLYIFDEPTTGLHFDDIAKLLGGARAADRKWRQPADHRAQSRRDPGGRLGDRSGSGGRRSRRRDCRGGDAGGYRQGQGVAYGAVSFVGKSKSKAEGEEAKVKRVASLKSFDGMVVWYRYGND